MCVSPLKRRSPARTGQTVILATLILVIVAAVAAGFALFVNNALSTETRSREQTEALLLAEAGLQFVNDQLLNSPFGADWRPRLGAPGEFDPFERLRGWDRRDREGDWFGKYSAQPAADLIGGFGGRGSFLVKVKFLPEIGMLKIISIGRPVPNSPIFRRLVAYKPIPLLQFQRFVMAKGDGLKPDGLLLSGTPIPGIVSFPIAIGQRIGDADRDGSADLPAPGDLDWLRSRTFMSPVQDRDSPSLPPRILSAPVQVNSDLVWYGENILQLGLPDTVFAGTPLLTPELLRVARGVWHDANPFLPTVGNLSDPLVTLADRTGGSIAAGEPSPSPTFQLFPVNQIPRYRDGWVRLQRFFLFPVSFLDPSQAGSRWAPPVEPIRLAEQGYRIATQRAALPASLFGYFSIPPSPAPQRPTAPLSIPPFHTVLNTSQPLRFRGIYVDNGFDLQFPSFPQVDVDGDGDLDNLDIDGDGDVDAVDLGAFNDRYGQFRSELVQVYDWTVRPVQAVPDPNNPGRFLPSPWRRLFDSGWFQDQHPATDRNLLFERNTEETISGGQYVSVNNRALARLRYVPPGVQVFVEVEADRASPDPSRPDLFQRIYLIRHDINNAGTRNVFRDPVGNPLSDDPSTPIVNEGARLVFVDRISRTDLQRTPLPTVVLFAEGNVRISGTFASHLIVFSRGTIYVEGPLIRYRDPQRDDDGDGRFDEDPINGSDDDGDGSMDEDPVRGIDDDGDGRFDEDPINDRDDDGDGRVDEDPLDYGSCQLLARQNLAVNGTALLPLVTRVTPDGLRAARPLDLSRTGEGDISWLEFVPALGEPDADQDGRIDRSGVAYWDFPALRLDRNALASLPEIANGFWSLRLVLMHRGRVGGADDPWTNVRVELEVRLPHDQDGDGNPDDDLDLRIDEELANGIDDDADGRVDEDIPRITVLYGPDEPKRSFPVATRWYSDEEWGILDIPIPPTAFDMNNDGLVDPASELKPALESSLRVKVLSPVGGELVPPGRDYRRYEIAGVSIRLEDQNGSVRPIWEWQIQALAVAQEGTIGIIGSPFLDQTDEIVASYGPDPINQPPVWRSYTWWTDPLNGPRWKREWASRYLRLNSVRLMWIGSLSERVTALTMLARLSLNLGQPLLFFKEDRQLDRLATAHPSRPDVFVELPHFAYDLSGLFDEPSGGWGARVATINGISYRSPPVPRLPVSPDLFILPSQVGPD